MARPMEDKTFYGKYRTINDIIYDLKSNVSINSIVVRLEFAKEDGYELVKQQKNNIGYWNCATDITY